jgi:uncharacterized membrane protein YhiD involved in acid resistance
MLEDLFGADYYAFPSFEVALFSLLLSFVLSTIIGLTYKFTYSEDRFPRHFFHAIVLSSTVSSMVIMAVGDNLAAGFGIIGAIAIIRFRTLIRDPRNIIFIFASLSVGIATGVYGYAIAVSGTFIFCLVAILLHFSAFGPHQKEYFDIVFSVRNDPQAELFRQFLLQRSITGKTIRYRRLTEDKGSRFTFRIEIGESVDRELFFEELGQLTGYYDIRMSRSEEVQL